jgi:uncharacterized cupin superfamily protein
MERKKAKVIRGAEIAEKAKSYAQRLNPASRFRGADLARRGGLQRVAVSWAALEPGKDSFAYHAHDLEEEWMYVLSGRAVALVDGEEIEVGPGDFLAFPAPQAPHLLRNRGSEPVVYLMGGERLPMDVITYPALGGKRYLLRGEDGRAAFYELGTPEFPFGPAGDE